MWVKQRVETVLLDLDDTIYPQSQWLRGAWTRVAAVASMFDIPRDALRHALEEVCADGSDRGRIIDRALERIGATSAPIPSLVAAFRDHQAVHLDAYPGVRDALRSLRSRARLGVVTDGDPQIQRSKLRSLGLADVFDVVVISDEYGRSRRKPDPYALLLAAAKLQTDPDGCVYIGDRPAKDVAAARAAGMRSIRVHTGEYAKEPDHPAAWRRVADLPAAVRSIGPLLPDRATGAWVLRSRGR